MIYEFDGRVAFCQDDEGNDVWAIDTHSLSPNAARFVKWFVTREWLREDHPDFEKALRFTEVMDVRNLLAEVYVLEYQSYAAGRALLAVEENGSTFAPHILLMKVMDAARTTAYNHSLSRQGD